MNRDIIIAKWIAGEITDTAFQKEVSPQEYVSYLKLRKALQLYEATQQEIPKELFEKIKHKTIDKKPAKHFSLYKYAVATASVVAIILLFFGVNKFLSPTSFTVETANNQTKEIQLFGKDKAVLDAQSELIYFKEKPQATLKGTAYFDILSDDLFTLKTDKATLTTQQARFEVKSILDMLQITNYEGKLHIVLNGKTLILSSGQSLMIYNNQIQNFKNKTQKPEILEQESRFTATPLKYILQDLQNRYNINIITNQVDLNKKFTGSYTHDDLDLSLQTVFKSLQIPYRYRDKHTIILSP